MAGFTWVGTLSGAPMMREELLFKDTETLTEGDIVNLESGEVDLGATADTTFIGVVISAGATAGTDSTTKIWVATNPDMILRVNDANARVAGLSLDLTGATGAQTVTTSSNANFRVILTSAANEPTYVMFNPKQHIYAKEV
jgi:hypothetical protein